MLNIIIIPAFVVAMLAVYLAAEESVLKRVEAKTKIETAQEYYDWIEQEYQDWLESESRAEDFYASPVNRIRLWLANIIAP